MKLKQIGSCSSEPIFFFAKFAVQATLMYGLFHMSTSWFFRNSPLRGQYKLKKLGVDIGIDTWKKNRSYFDLYASDLRFMSISKIL